MKAAPHTLKKTPTRSKKAHSTLKKVFVRPKTTKASTVRLNPDLQSALDEISGHLGKTKNKIVNEALADYLEKSGYQLRNDIDGTLQKLRAYRSKDPSFEADIERFASAESAHAKDDSHEGSIEMKSEQSLSHEIQELIHA
jgi:predicted DNA-binding protein